MVFYLTTLNLAHILKKECLVTIEKNKTPETEATKEAWLYFDFLCWNYIFSGLIDSLYNVYCNAYQTSRQLCNTHSPRAAREEVLLGKNKIKPG